MAQKICFYLFICSFFAGGQILVADERGDKAACQLQLDHSWLPIDCLFVGNQKQRLLALEICQRKAAKLENLSAFPRDWQRRTKGTKCFEPLALRYDQLIYAERLLDTKHVWNQVGKN